MIIDKLAEKAVTKLSITNSRATCVDNTLDPAAAAAARTLPPDFTIFFYSFSFFVQVVSLLIFVQL
jgi:hypothetical protein